jgi:hypothetical protein
LEELLNQTDMSSRVDRDRQRYDYFLELRYFC